MLGRFKKSKLPSLPPGNLTHHKKINIALPEDIQTWKHNHTVNLDTYRQILMIRPKTFVDVGAGDGFYGKLIKRLFPDCKTLAIEKNNVYPEQFELNKIYDELWNEDIITAINKLESKDLIIFGDVLEHLEKQPSSEVLRKSLDKAKFVIVNSPLGFQKQEHEYKEEIHRCGLDYSDFRKYNVLEFNVFDEIMFNCALLGNKNNLPTNS